MIASSPRAECDLYCQKSERDESLVDVKVLQPEHLNKVSVSLVMYQFKTVEIEVTNYEGSKLGKMEHPAHAGAAWLVEYPHNVKANILDIRDSLRRIAAEKDKRYMLTPDYLTDLEKKEEIRVRSSIDFFLTNRELFPDIGTVRMVASGPFWKDGEYGEKAIGLLKTGKTGLHFQQKYLSFSAKHVLCFTEAGISLINPEIIMRNYPDHSAIDMEQKINDEVSNNCRNAIQVGPTYYEDRLPHESVNRVGISGSSIDEHRQIMLIRVDAKNKKKLFLLTTLANVSPFDAMVLVPRIMKEIEVEPNIKWAVGLQDGQFLSGPVLFLDDKTPLRLGPTHLPTGALLIFQ